MQIMLFLVYYWNYGLLYNGKRFYIIQSHQNCFYKIRLSLWSRDFYK